MTRLLPALQELRRARTTLAVSWARTLSLWRDTRAREYEAIHHLALDRTAATFERALEELDRDVDKAVERLPD